MIYIVNYHFEGDDDEITFRTFDKQEAEALHKKLMNDERIDECFYFEGESNY